MNPTNNLLEQAAESILRASISTPYVDAYDFNGYNDRILESELYPPQNGYVHLSQVT